MVPRCSDKISRVSSYSLSLTGLCFRIQGYHLLWPDFPDCSTSTHPITTTGLFPFRSPLLRESRFISLPPLTEMFQFTGFASRRSEMTALAHRRVSPFGHPRINACVPLPLAYRSLPRPSSPLCAQASPTCFRSLDHNILCQAEHARSTSLQVKRLVQLANAWSENPALAGSIAISRVDSYP